MICHQITEFKLNQNECVVYAWNLIECSIGVCEARSADFISKWYTLSGDVEEELCLLAVYRHIFWFPHHGQQQ